MSSVPYSQRAAVWLQKLGSWWRLLNRGTAVKEVEKILLAAEAEIGSVKNAFSSEQSKHSATKDQLKDAVSRHDEAARRLMATEDELGAAKEILSAEQSRHQVAKTKLDLITSTLGASTQEHPKCLAFRKFLDEFVKFSNDENLYEREADAILRLQAVEEAMRLLGRVPLFREKTIVAVAGGFSSGKSSLVTSFFDPKYKVTLPIGMDPVTAIPTYISSGNKTSVIGFPAHGGTLNIASDVFAQMRHEFLASLGFDIRSILPFIMLETPWRTDWGNLCFIDTPGYNAPVKGGLSTAADDKTTAEALLQADALLWVIGLDANGEISFDDLQYLLKHAKHIPLAIVVNKADQRPPSQVHDVIEQISETLESYGVEYCSISAYSSVDGREYECVGQSLKDFLDTWNQLQLQRDEKLFQEVLNVLDDYVQSFEKAIELHKKHRQAIHSLKLDLDGLGLFDDVEETSTIGNKPSELTSFLHRIIKKNPGKPAIDDTLRGETKEKALERLQQLSELFAIEKIEGHKTEALRLRDDVNRLFSQSWDY